MRKYINADSIMPVYSVPMPENNRIRRLTNSCQPGDDYASSLTDIPYLNAMDDTIRDNILKGARKILIVCEDVGTARKAYKYYMRRTRQFDSGKKNAEFDPDMDEEIRALYSETSNEDVQIYEASMTTYPEPTKTIDNIYSKSLVCEMSRNVPYLFTGFEDDEDIGAKVEALRTLVTDDYRFLWIRPDQADSSWVLDLMISDEFVPVRVEAPSDEYYAGLLSGMLDRTGARLSPDTSPMEIILTIRRKLGALFDEGALDWMYQKALEKKADGLYPAGNASVGPERIELDVRDFLPDYDPQNTAFNALSRMIGLKNVKDVIGESLAFGKELVRNSKLKSVSKHDHMIFCGNPGTGKTTVAELYAECMAESGLSNGVFVNASREDLIGKYVGQTASKVSLKFKDARGGILFVDEAGFFLNNESGGYLREAVKEFVRYMETMPDVTVIFGMYEKEVEGFLALDSGLRSRISRVVRFEDYTDDEILQIAEYMCDERGYKLDPQAEPVIHRYISGLRDKDDFGNARDVRRLIDNAVRAHCVALHSDAKVGIRVKADPDMISVDDIKAGITRSQVDINDGNTRRRIGFIVPETSAELLQQEA